ncbi:hypothetical protein JRQ81_001513 [Phrynocephalus forsythii]|uniref:Dual specificity phosphatase catalytic domain-containing protein n=1 Tax=Phrynocephalus forsythii TaxID=171643 RepID=A0A9Q0Y843_9SAUR|nr:hypothetical protein JRQ81_001513 [Phrynocephalus forsythii]
MGMHSLAQEIQCFSKANLRKQCTRVTTLSGKQILETWRDARVQVVEEVAAQGPEGGGGGACGYVQDLSLDLRVGLVKPWLLVGVSRAAAIVIGFLMHSEGLSFSRAFSLVKNARPAICPNPGFMEQLHKYHQCSNKNGNLNDAE